MRPEQRTPLEFAADAYRGAIEERTRLEADFERMQADLEAAQRRIAEADLRVKEARRRLVEAAELPTAKETQTP